MKNLHPKQILNMQVIIRFMKSGSSMKQSEELSDREKVFLRAMASMKILTWRLG
ncbi:MAG: hypothetical protein ACLSFZ_00695 [Frisingicoccus sp.]